MDSLIRKNAFGSNEVNTETVLRTLYFIRGTETDCDYLTWLDKLIARFELQLKHERKDK